MKTNIKILFFISLLFTFVGCSKYEPLRPNSDVSEEVELKSIASNTNPVEKSLITSPEKENDYLITDPENEDEIETSITDPENEDDKESN
jgi:predicted small lipoprotein YifL